MAASCYMGNPGIRVNNQRKDSKLYKDLREKACKTALEANRAYSIFSNETVKQFILDHTSTEVDENGELKFDSLIANKVLTFDDSTQLYSIKDSDRTEMAKNDLHARYSAGSSTREKIIAACAFNSSSPFNDKYFAVYEEKTGEVMLRTLQTSNLSERVPLQEELVRNFSKFDANTRLAAFLAMKGFQIEEADLSHLNEKYEKVKNNDMKIDTRTGLITIVRIANNTSATEKNEVLQKMVGELLYSLGQGTPFIRRIEGLLSTDVLNAINVADNKRDTLVTLLGQAFCDSTSFQEKTTGLRSVVGNIIDRIATLIKTCCKWISKKFTQQDELSIQEAIEKANEFARELVYKETNPLHQEEYQSAMQNKVDLFQPLTFEDRQLQNITTYLNNQALNLKKINEDFGLELENIVKTIETDKLSVEAKHFEKTSIFYTQAIAEIIQKSVTQVAALFAKDGIFKTSLDEWNKCINDSSYIELDMVNASKSLRGLTIALETCEHVNALLTECKAFLRDTRNVTSINANANNLTMEALTHAQRAINKVLYNVSEKDQNVDSINDDSIPAIVHTARMQFVLKFLEGQLGSTFIHRTAHKIFNPRWKNGKFMLFEYVKETPMRLNEMGIPIDEQGNEIHSLEGIIKNIQGPLGRVSKFNKLMSYGNSPDVVVQLMDLINKNQKQIRNRMAYNYRVKIVELRDKAIKLGLYDKEKGQYKIAKFYETYEGTDEKTGNLISELNWGEWERDKDFFLRQTRIEFDQSVQADTNDKVLQKIRWKAYKELALKKWHKEHSTYDKKTNTHRPKKFKDVKNGIYSKYYNPKYNELSQAEKSLLGEAMQLKREIDTAHLPVGATVAVRAPQFRGDFADRRLGRKQAGEAGIKYTWDNIKTEMATMANNFARTAVWDDYGSDVQYDDIEDSDLRYESDNTKLERIALYGINKRYKWGTDDRGNKVRVTDMSELSTDLFGSMYAYASMATQYSSMNAVVDAMELTVDQMNERVVEEGRTESEVAKHRASTENKETMAHFLERQIYGKNYTRMRNKKVLKAIRSINSTGSVLTLGFNYLGGAVNKRTGKNEMRIEAMSGEFFNNTDLAKAKRHWFIEYRSFLKNPTTRQSMSGHNSKPAAICTYFDVHNDMFEDSKNWNTRKRRYLDISLGEFAMYPYASGEAYMQAVTFMACLEHVKVWKKVDGKYQKMSLYEAYENKKISDNGDCMITLGPDIVYQDFGDDLVRQEKAMKDTPQLKQLQDMANTYQAEVQKAKNDGQPDSVEATFREYIEKKNPSLIQTLNDYNIKLEIKDNGIITPVDVKTIESQINSVLRNYIVDIFYEMNLRAKMQEVSNRCHGVYNNEDAIEASDYLLGKLILTMKGWAVGQATKAFKPHTYSTIFDREDEGYVNTYVKNLLSLNRTASGENRWHLRDSDPTMTKFDKTLAATIMTTNAISPITGLFNDFLPFLGMINILTPDSYYKKWGFEDYEIANFKRMHAKVMMIKLTKLMSQFLYYLWQLAPKVPDDDEDDEWNEEIEENLKSTHRISPAYAWLLIKHTQMRMLKTLTGTAAYISLRTWHEQMSLVLTSAIGQNTWESLISLLPISTSVLKTLTESVGNIVVSEIAGNTPEEIEFYIPAHYEDALNEYETDRITQLPTSDYSQSIRVYNSFSRAYYRRYDPEEKTNFDKLLRSYLTNKTSFLIKNNKDFMEFASQSLDFNEEAKEWLRKYYQFDDAELKYKYRHDLAKELYYVQSGGESENTKGYKAQRKFQSKGRTRLLQNSPLRTYKQILDINRTYTNYKKFTEGTEQTEGNPFIDNQSTFANTLYNIICQ